MNRSLALLAIGLFFGGGIGFLTAAANGVTLNGHVHDVPDGHGAEVPMAMDHSHDALRSVPASTTMPELTLALVKDPMSGWNLHVEPKDFRFAPEHASQPHIDGEGHAHVYVNGTKIARLYGPWMHIPSLPQGQATIEVVLNSNDHRPIANGTDPISASVSVEVE